MRCKFSFHYVPNICKKTLAIIFCSILGLLISPKECPHLILRMNCALECLRCIIACPALQLSELVSRPDGIGSGTIEIHIQPGGAARAGLIQCRTHRIVDREAAATMAIQYQPISTVLLDYVCIHLLIIGQSQRRGQEFLVASHHHFRDDIAGFWLPPGRH